MAKGQILYNHPAFKDITGIRIGRLTAIKPSHSQGGVVWLFQCDCGKIVKRRAGCMLRSARYKRKSACEECKSLAIRQVNKRLFRLYRQMKNRCLNERTPSYRHYGGRGIKICKKWMRFEGFLEFAVKSGYKDNLTIERINVNGDYEPRNCKWIPLSEQRRNRTDTRLIYWRGKAMCALDWATLLKINPSTIYGRLNRGWSINKTFTYPIRNSRFR